MDYLPPNLLSWTRDLTKRYGVRAGVRFGQHFLVDRQVLRDIIQAAALKPGDSILEAGGGSGVLTLALLEQGVRVVSVELDHSLADALHKLAQAGDNLAIIEGDILKISDEVLSRSLELDKKKNFSIVANLPYEISGKFLRRFLSGSLRPQNMTVLLQKEVAERLEGRLGNMSLLSLQAQLAATEVKIVRHILPSSFFPPPQVQSALVVIKLRNELERRQKLSGLTEDNFWRVAHAGFSSRRKFLFSNLLKGLGLERLALEKIFQSCEVKTTARAQELSLESWVRLARLVNKQVLLS